MIVRDDKRAFSTVAQESIGTRLGEGLRESGHLADVPVRRTLDAVRRFSFEAHKAGGRVFAIATSAVRRADNAAMFADSIRNITGADLHVLSGDEEARYSFAGALAAHPPSSRTALVGVLDVGGGSAEYATGTSVGEVRSVSCEIGAVRLSERVPALCGLSGKKPDITHARAEARSALEPMKALRGAHTLYAVGGTATTLAAIIKQGNRDAADGLLVARAELRAMIDRFAQMPLAARKEVAGLNPQRADIFPGGMIVIDEALGTLEIDRMTVSVGDLLLGYLVSQ